VLFVFCFGVSCKYVAWVVMGESGFYICPRCGNPKALYFREGKREIVECGDCGYREENGIGRWLRK